jgi:hypothetical protein
MKHAAVLKDGGMMELPSNANNVTTNVLNVMIYLLVPFALYQPE